MPGPHGDELLPGISVVIPAYNYGHFIATALESALSQDYPECEILVVDDGSTDHTAEVVSRYAARGVKLIPQKNAGLSAARNTGIRHARHPLLTFLDADDALLPGALRRCAATMSGLPEAFAVVGFGVTRTDVSGVPVASASRAEERSREITARDLLVKTRFPCTALVKKDALLATGGFDITLTSSEDRDMWLRIAATRRIWLLPNPFLLLRQHAGSMRRNADRMTANTRRVLRKAFAQKLVPRWDLRAWLRAVSFNCFESALMFFHERRLGRAMANLALSLIFWPLFLDHRSLGMPPLFRLRALARNFLPSRGHE